MRGEGETKRELGKTVNSILLFFSTTLGSLGVMDWLMFNAFPWIFDAVLISIWLIAFFVTIAPIVSILRWVLGGEGRR